MPKAARLTDTGSGHDCFPPSPVNAGSPDVIINGLPAARQGDPLAPHSCTCDGGHGVHPRTITAGSASVLINGKPAARIGDSINCGGVISSGSGNVIIGDTPYKSPVHDCAAQAVKTGAPLVALSPMLSVTPVFAKSCLRAEGCTDAGEEEETHDNFAPMGFYRVVPVAAETEPEPEQRAQAAKKPGSAAPVTSPGSGQPPTSPAEKPWYRTLFSSEPAATEPESLPDEKPAEASTAALSTGAPLAWLAGNYSVPGSWSLKVAAAVNSATTAAADAAVAGGRVLPAGPGAPLAALAVGMMPGKLNEGEQDFIDKMRLQQIAEKQGTASTRVRFQWEKQADGRLMPVGYHTELGSGYDQVPVRMMALNTETGYYEFTTPGPRPATILWTPDKVEVDYPNHTGNEDPVTLPPHITVLPLPEESGWHIESYPAPEERGFRDYILILPIPDIPPLYIYLSAPPVEPLEVGEYGDLIKRSVKDGMEIDHIPSQAALRIYLNNQTGGLLTDGDISKMLQKAPAVATPGNLHRDYSETYAGRNNKIENGLPKSARDARDIRAAVESNVEAMVPGWLEEGYTMEQVNEMKADLIKMNDEMGFFKPWKK